MTAPAPLSRQSARPLLLRQILDALFNLRFDVCGHLGKVQFRLGSFVNGIERGGEDRFGVLLAALDRQPNAASHRCSLGPLAGCARPYQPRRTPEPYDPHANAPPHAVDQCVLEEVGGSVGGVLHALRLLQFLRNSQDAARHACDGNGTNGSECGTSMTSWWPGEALSNVRVCTTDRKKCLHEKNPIIAAINHEGAIHKRNVCQARRLSAVVYLDVR